MLLGTGLLSPTGGLAALRPEQPAVVYLAGMTVAAVVLFERVGFLLTMALFLVVAMRMLGRMNWGTAVVVALVGSVTSYVVFVRVLLINLPSGILPF
jgi:putative tricarboxylic transport membrane protein